MKKLMVALGVILVILIGAALVIPSLVPAEKIKDQVVAQVKSATGRDLTIDGKVSVSIFPSLSVQVSNIALSSPPGFHSPDLLRLGAVDVRLKVLPLLSGKVAVDSFVLVDPIITLEVARNGKANWQFDTAAAKPAEVKNAASATAADKSASASAPVSDIALGQVRISNGRLTYLDDSAGTREEVEGLSLAIDLKSLDDPLSIKGGAKWRGKPVEVAVAVAKPRAVIDGSLSPLELAVKGDTVGLDFKGEASPAGLKGALDLSVPSVRGLILWTTGRAPALGGTALGPFAVKGNVNASPSRVALTQAEIALDAIKAKGDFTTELGGARPSLKGRLDVEALDLNPYLVGPESTGKPAGSGGGKPGSAASHGWSDDTIDASGLKAADVDFTLTVGSITVNKIKIGKSALHLGLNAGRMIADLNELALYKGNGKGRLLLDGTQGGVAVEANFQLKSLQAEPFLTDAADFTRLEGTGNADLQLTARGKSQRMLISTLTGKGNVGFLNGAIRGINLADMIRNVATSFTGNGSNSNAKTEFAELTGSVTITNGIVSNNDLSLKSPLLRVAGAGNVDLPQQRMKYRVEPKVVASLEGQGGKGDVAGLGVPVLIEGPWDNLSYRPDLAALVKGQANKAVNDVLNGGAGNLNPAKLFGR